VPAILSYLEIVSKDYPNMFSYVFKERLLDYLSPEEKKQFIHLFFFKYLHELLKPVFNVQIGYQKWLLDIFEERLFDYLCSEEKIQIVRQNFLNLLIRTESMTRSYESKWRSEDGVSEETLSYTYLIIINAIEGTKLIDKFFDIILDPLFMFTERSDIIFKTISVIKKKQELKKSHNTEKTENDYWKDLLTAFVNIWNFKCNQEFNRN
jgi:hypothetical protein